MDAVATGGNKAQPSAQGSDAPAPTRRTKPVLSYLVRLATAAGVLLYLAHEINFAQVWAAIRQVSAGAIVAALATNLVLNGIIAYRLVVLVRAQGIALTASELFEINLATIFYGLFLPGGNVAGTVVRFYRLSRDTAGSARVLLAVGYDRFAAVFSIALVGLVLWVVDGAGKTPAALAVFGVGLCGILPLLVPLAAPTLLERIDAWVRAHSRTWARSGSHRFLHALAVGRRFDAPVLARLLVLSLTAQVFGILCWIILARSVGVDVSWATVGWIRGAAMILTIIPVSVGGLGVREGALLVLLRPYAVVDQHALALSLLVFAMTVVVPGLLGGVLEGLRELRPRAPQAR